MTHFDDSTGMGYYTIGPIVERFIGHVNFTAPFHKIVNFCELCFTCHDNEVVSVVFSV